MRLVRNLQGRGCSARGAVACDVTSEKAVIANRLQRGAEIPDVRRRAATAVESRHLERRQRDGCRLGPCFFRKGELGGIRQILPAVAQYVGDDEITKCEVIRYLNVQGELIDIVWSRPRNLIVGDGHIGLLNGNGARLKDVRITV